MTPFRVINIGHLFGATRYSVSGLVRAWRGEQAFRHEVMVLPVLVVLLLFTGGSGAEWLLVLGGWLVVMAVELLNSAIEQVFDRISTDWSPQIKAGKDMASAAVFLLLMINAGIWLYVFL